MRKKLACFSVALLVAMFGVAACGGGDEPKPDDQQPPKQGEQVPSKQEDPVPPTQDDQPTPVPDDSLPDQEAQSPLPDKEAQVQ